MAAQPLLRNGSRKLLNLVK